MLILACLFVWIAIGLIWSLCLDPGDRRYQIMNENLITMIIMIVFWFPLMIVFAEGAYDGD